MKLLTFILFLLTFFLAEIHARTEFCFKTELKHQSWFEPDTIKTNIVNDINNKLLTISPNPVDEILNINSSEIKSGLLSVEIYDILGNKLLNQNYIIQDYKLTIDFNNTYLINYSGFLTVLIKTYNYYSNNIDVYIFKLLKI